MSWLSCSHLWCGHWCSLVKMQMVWVSCKKRMGKSLTSQKAPRRPPGLPSTQGSSWSGEYHPNEWSAHGARSFPIFAAVVKIHKWKHEESKKACDSGECWDSKGWWSLSFSPPLLSSKAERQKNPSAFVKIACPSLFLINPVGRSFLLLGVFLGLKHALYI